MEAHKKKERIDLLIQIGREVLEESRAKHQKELPSADLNEICFDEESIPLLVDEYAEHLEDWRKHHIDADKLVDGDKIAAFTATLIMRHEVFYSETGAVNTNAATFVNHVFAIRMAELFVRRKRFGFNAIEKKLLIHSLTHCNDHNPAMKTWAVATMAKLAERATVKEPAFAD